MATRQRVQVHIDWSDICNQNAETALDTISADKADSFVRWIEAFPNRGDVEVHLNTGRKSDTTRKFQRTLQTLGCTVVARYFMPVMA